MLFLYGLAGGVFAEEQTALFQAGFNKDLKADFSKGVGKPYGSAGIEFPEKDQGALVLKKGVHANEYGLKMPYSPLTYPSENNFSSDAGSLEFRFLLKKTNKAFSYFPLLSIIKWKGGGADSHVIIQLRGQDMKLIVHESTDNYKQAAWIIIPQSIEPDKWYTFKLIWNGQEREVYLDGNPVKNYSAEWTEINEKNSGFIRGAQEISIGGKHKKDNSLPDGTTVLFDDLKITGK